MISLIVINKKVMIGLCVCFIKRNSGIVSNVFKILKFINSGLCLILLDSIFVIGWMIINISSV